VTFSEQQIDEWLDAKEDEHLEFKEAKSNFHFEKLVKYCAALANEGGGYILLGVTDKRPRQVVGTYTRKRGLDRETNKKLLLRHIEESVPSGTRMAELLQVLPGLSRNQVLGLLSELRDEGRVYVEGQRRWARWLPIAMARREDEAATANESKEEA
jgi:Putative DNA-binding domain